MNIDMQDMGKKLVVILSSFGLLSSLGYYLINLENKALGKAVQTPQAIIHKNTKNNITAGTERGMVTQVIDGDTIKVRLSDGSDITVRMMGIDTPEARHSPRAEKRGVADCFANEATSALKVMIDGREVQLETDPSKDVYDKYGRLLAYVFREGDAGRVNINQKMIQQGFAYEYTYRGEKYAYQTDFKSAQKEAEQTKKGLWGEGMCE